MNGGWQPLWINQFRGASAEQMLGCMRVSERDRTRRGRRFFAGSVYSGKLRLLVALGQDGIAGQSVRAGSLHIRRFLAAATRTAIWLVAVGRLIKSRSKWRGNCDINPVTLSHPPSNNRGSQTRPPSRQALSPSLLAAMADIISASQQSRFRRS